MGLESVEHRLTKVSSGGFPISSAEKFRLCSQRFG
jgi:hypothetical protein